jgi:peptide-methionine (S)-S-oxide reductase
MHLGGLFIGLSSYYDATLHSAARLRGILATMKKTAVVLGLLLAMGSSGAHQESPDRQAAKATFAGGCFWCMEEAFEKVEGVSSVISGYAGGSKANPTYKEVSSGRTGHTEAIEVIYDPESVGYRQLLQVFWKALDESKPFDEPIVTEILPASMFYPAEEYHQDYYKRNPIRYRYYKYGCGRAQRLKELWGPEK